MMYGKKIRELREERGMTQAELAQRSFLTGAMISQVEAGIKKLSLESAVQIARVLECGVDDFLAE